MKTFSEILAEHLEQSKPSPSSFFHRTSVLEPDCIPSLMSAGFKVTLKLKGRYTLTDSLEPINYILCEAQQAAAMFFNQHLAYSQQLKGRFSRERLKRCYRVLARKFHPDLGGNSDLFLVLQAQYKILLDFLSPIK